MRFCRPQSILDNRAPWRILKAVVERHVRSFSVRGRENNLQEYGTRAAWRRDLSSVIENATAKNAVSPCRLFSDSVAQVPLARGALQGGEAAALLETDRLPAPKLLHANIGVNAMSEISRPFPRGQIYTNVLQTDQAIQVFGCS